MFLSELEWVILTFPDLWQSVCRSSCASSNSGKYTNVETKATRHKMDDNGTPQSSHIQIQGKAMSLDTQLKHKALLPIWNHFHGRSNVLYDSEDFFPVCFLIKDTI